MGDVRRDYCGKCGHLKASWCRNPDGLLYAYPYKCACEPPLRVQVADWAKREPAGGSTGSGLWGKLERAVTFELQLTDAVAEAICKEVAKGTPVTLAAQMAGFTARALFKWQARGNADIEAGNGGTVDARGNPAGGTVFSRLVHRLARARGQMAAPLVSAAAEGCLEGRDVRGILSALKTFLPAHFGDRALEVQAAVEAASEQPEPAAGAEQPGTVAVELIRCGTCGIGSAVDEPGRRAAYCAGCGAKLAGPT